jgi:hypothetical protein
MLKKKFIITMIVFVLLCLPCYASDITLGWLPNSESDLAGYKIYYNTDSSGPPYDGIGIFEGPSPITLHIDPGGDPNYYVDNEVERCEYTLAGLDLTSGDYWFVLTAYDDEASYNESGYSNEVSTFDPVDPPPNGGSSGGGCFISSISDLMIKITAWSVVFAMLAMAIIGLEFVISMISRLDSNIKTIIVSSSVIIITVVVIGNSSYEGIPLFSIATMLLAVIGIFSILAKVCAALTMLMKRGIGRC